MKIPPRRCAISCKSTLTTRRQPWPGAGWTASSKRAKSRTNNPRICPRVGPFRMHKRAGAGPCGPALGNAPQLPLRLEVEAQTELNESRTVILIIQRTETPAADISKSKRIAEHRMVEHVGHLAVETSAHPFRDFGGLGDAEVHVPAVKAAVESAAGAAIDRGIGRREEGESAQRIVVDGIRVGKCCQ